MRQSRAITAIVAGGVTAATLDLVYACTRNAGFDKPPVWTFQAIASGLLGRDAWQSGDLGAALGVLMHYSILLVAATLYFVASRRSALMTRHALACGAVFGVLVYLCMNFVVLPLSAFPLKISYPPLKLLEGFASHALFVGVPIALAVRWAQAGTRSVAPEAAIASTTNARGQRR